MTSSPQHYRHHCHEHQPRIPTSLQAVFLASNRGVEVNEPPPSRVAFKVFSRNWRFQSSPKKSPCDRSLDASSSSFSTENTAISDSDSRIGSFKKRHNLKWSFKGLKSRNGERISSSKQLVDVDDDDEETEETISPLGISKKILSDLPPSSSACSPPDLPPSSCACSPQVYFDNAIRSRGYYTNRFKSLQTAYYNKPTPYQIASYGDNGYLGDLVRRNDLATFTKLMGDGSNGGGGGGGSGILSPNACNAYGESILHLVCRLGKPAFLKVLLQAGASIQVCDDSGRTPLHDACWTSSPCFEVVLLLLRHGGGKGGSGGRRDLQLFHLMDRRRATPLSYVPKKDWAAWIHFLDSVMDEFWPSQRGKRRPHHHPSKRNPVGSDPDVVHEDEVEDEQVLALMGPNTRPLSTPPNSNYVSCELACMVASGKITPKEARFLFQKDYSFKRILAELDDDEDESNSDDIDDPEEDVDYDDDDDDDDGDDEGDENDGGSLYKDSSETSSEQR